MNFSSQTLVEYLSKKSIAISSCTKHQLKMEICERYSEIVESYSASLVREFLYRKGLKTTLTTLDSEFPRDSLSINSSSILVRNLRIENIIKMNRHSRNPYNSILEVIVHHIKIDQHIFGSENLKIKKHNPPTLLTLSNLKSLHNHLNEKGENIDFLTLIKLYCGCCTEKSVQERNHYKLLRQNSSLFGRQNDIKRDENGEATIEFDEKFYYTQREPQVYTQKETSTLTEKEDILKSFILGDIHKNESEENTDSTDNTVNIFEEGSPTNSACSPVNTASPKRTLNSDRSTSAPKRGTKPDMSLTKDTAENVLCPVSLEIPTIVFSDVDSREDEIDCHYPNGKQFEQTPYTSDLTTECSDDESANSEVSRKSDSLNEDNIASDFHETHVPISELGKIENNKFISSDCENMSKEIQTEYLLKKILLANNENVSKQWLGEGFMFDKSPTSYGLIQTKEGCSGVLAAVNAYVIKELLFKDIKNDIEYLRPNESQLDPALLEGMLQILWQAGESKATITVLHNGQKEIKLIEDIINNVTYKTFTSRKDAYMYLKDHISIFTKPGSHGCLLFLISAILSHGIEKTLEDMNGIPSLINSNGYSTIELVNLLLSGIAVSNVFDNYIKLQFTTIRGIPKRSDVGYLSIKEHFKCCKVGSYLKTPRFPIWLVHNENQFTILFSCTKQLLSDWKVERKFIMTYYDPLKNLGDEIRLSVDTTLADGSNNARDNVKAIVENCVRTKWKDANITWK